MISRGTFLKALAAATGLSFGRWADRAGYIHERLHTPEPKRIEPPFPPPSKGPVTWKHSDTIVQMEAGERVYAGDPLKIRADGRVETMNNEEEASKIFGVSLETKSAGAPVMVKVHGI